MLATDLAGGWIPPGLAIPIGLELPAPRARCADLDVILGPAILAAVYEPGQPLASIADTDPVQTSENSRWAPAVEDLGWELSRATKWREGLPRLAHTLPGPFRHGPAGWTPKSHCCAGTSRTWRRRCCGATRTTSPP